ncbi:hypothetical protein E2C01_095824 [Portunus trituberculatus]|uniref:Uncharacterized protein n=1 Tax=Portunus trituberculatus TaxID=210409 RepID=A0A5B7K519_PORTR|nr:hypothetical protein [Portunus trituberculatus]
MTGQQLHSCGGGGVARWRDRRPASVPQRTASRPWKRSLSQRANTSSPAGVNYCRWEQQQQEMEEREG